MVERFCVLYLDHRAEPPAKRLSISYDSVEMALSAARALTVLSGEPLQIRGSDGTVIEQRDLQAAIRSL